MNHAPGGGAASTLRDGPSDRLCAGPLATAQRRAVIAALRRALGQELHVLERRPALIRQQLANRLRSAAPSVWEPLAPRIEADLGPRMTTAIRGSGALLRTFPHGLGSVLCCAVSHEGSRIVSGDHLGDLRIWSLPSGELLSTAPDPGVSIHACAFAPEDGWLASGASDGTVKVWDALSLRHLETMSGHAEAVQGCAVSAERRLLVSASADRTLKVWDAITFREHGTLMGHTDAVLGCAFSPDGTRLVSASADRTLRAWDVATLRELAVMRGHAAAVHACALSPDGRWVASASADRTLKVWDTITFREHATLIGHTDAVLGCAFSPDGRSLVSASADRTLKVWDRGDDWSAWTGDPAPANVAPSPEAEKSPFMPRYMARLIREKEETDAITSADHASGTREGHALPVLACAVTPDARTLVSASADRTVKVWDAEVV